MRIAHLPLDVAWTLQGAASLAAVAAVVWTYWRRRDPVLSVALFVTATFLVTPYAFNYDMVVFGWVIALLHEQGSEPLDDRLAMAVWTLPITAMLLGLFGIPGSAAVLAAFAVRLLRRRRAPRPVGRRRRGRASRDPRSYSRGLTPSRTARKRGYSLLQASARAMPIMRTNAPGPNRTHWTIFMGVSVLASFASA